MTTWNRALRLQLFMGLVAGCAGKPPAAPAPSPASVYSRMPAEVDGFRLTQRSVVRGMPGDSAFRFRDSTRARVTVIVYNIGSNYRDADLNLSVMREGEMFRAVQGIQKERGTIADYTVSLSDTATINAGPSRVFEHRIVVQTRWPNDSVTIETQNLYAIAGKFVKVRATIPHAELASTRVPAFARALAARLSQ